MHTKERLCKAHFSLIPRDGPEADLKRRHKRTIYLIPLICYVEIAILRSKKEFSKNSSLVTLNSVSYCDIVAYSVDSTCATRHPTRHLNRCMLLRMCMLYAQFTLRSLVTHF